MSKKNEKKENEKRKLGNVKYSVSITYYDDTPLSDREQLRIDVKRLVATGRAIKF